MPMAANVSQASGHTKTTAALTDTATELAPGNLLPAETPTPRGPWTKQMPISGLATRGRRGTPDAPGAATKASAEPG